jgi:hypothetical protein
MGHGVPDHVSDNDRQVTAAEVRAERLGAGRVALNRPSRFCSSRSGVVREAGCGRQLGACSAPRLTDTSSNTASCLRMHRLVGGLALRNQLRALRGGSPSRSSPRSKASLAARTNARLSSDQKYDRDESDDHRGVRSGTRCPGCAFSNLPRSIASEAIFERDADEVTFPPYQAALSDGPKIVERETEVERNQVEAVQANASAVVGRIANVAIKNASSSFEE